jgi:hypothetical protein
VGTARVRRRPGRSPGGLDWADALYREALAVYDAAGVRKARASVIDGLGTVAAARSEG